MADNDGWGTGWNKPPVVNNWPVTKPNQNPWVTNTTKFTIIGVDTANGPDISVEHIVIVPETYTVQVVKVGDLAVHNDILDSADEEWIVTHIPTLTTFRRAVPEGKWSRQQLIDWCVKVQSELKDDWKQLATLNEKNYKDDAMKDVKERIQEHCLDTAVV